MRCCGRTKPPPEYMDGDVGEALSSVRAGDSLRGASKNFKIPGTALAGCKRLSQQKGKRLSELVGVSRL